MVRRDAPLQQARRRRFLAKLRELEAIAELSDYQRAMKANALLVGGAHEAARTLFAEIASTAAPDGPSSDYVRLYCRALLAEMEGREDEFARLAAAAARVPSRWTVRLNLPLN